VAGPATAKSLRPILVTGQDQRTSKKLVETIAYTACTLVTAGGSPARCTLGAMQHASGRPHFMYAQGVLIGSQDDTAARVRREIEARLLTTPRQRWLRSPLHWTRTCRSRASTALYASTSYCRTTGPATAHRQAFSRLPSTERTWSGSAASDTTDRTSCYTWCATASGNCRLLTTPAVRVVDHRQSTWRACPRLARLAVNAPVQRQTPA